MNFSVLLREGVIFLALNAPPPHQPTDLPNETRECDFVYDRVRVKDVPYEDFNLFQIAPLLYLRSNFAFLLEDLYYYSRTV